MSAYYNENDAGAAAWLRELIHRGWIASGVVDERSITEVQPDDLREFTQVHLFAGIGGWSFALRLAGWRDHRPVWTGSCPCQPFSVAGKQEGEKDRRHLWPEMFRLVREGRPECVFGEQVANAIGHGWFDGVSTDLEGEGYQVGAAVLGAHSVGAPHIRQRLWWVAESERVGRRGRNLRHSQSVEDGSPPQVEVAGSGPPRGVGDAECPAGARLGRDGLRPLPEQEADRHGASDPWARYDLLPCADGKARRVEPGSPPLAHGVPARVGRLRGYGNAIVPQVAATFIQAYLDTRKEP